MLINPISSANSPKPVFKRQNYVKAFNQVYNMQMSSLNSLVSSYNTIMKACMSISKAYAIPFFVTNFSQKGFWGNLLALIKPGHEPAYDELVKNSEEGTTLLYLEDDEPILNIVNNGRYREDNFFSRRKNGEKLNVNIVFRNPDSTDNKVIIYGTDYDGNAFIARGTADNPTTKMETFWSNFRSEKIKQRVLYQNHRGEYIVENYNEDGTPKTEGQNLVDDIVDTIRDTISSLFN